MQSGVVWYEVVVISADFMKILKDWPEAYFCKSVSIGGKIIKKPKEIFLAGSMEEVKNNLPAVIAGLVGSFDEKNIRVIERSTNCSACAAEKKKNPKKLIHCTHEPSTINRVWSMNIQSFPSLKNSRR